MRVRVQVDEATGQLYVPLDEGLVEDYFIQEGDLFTWVDEEDHFELHPAN